MTTRKHIKIDPKHLPNRAYLPRVKYPTFALTLLLIKTKSMKNQLVEIIEKYDMNGFAGQWDGFGRHIGGWGTDKNDWHGFCDYYEKNTYSI